MGKNCAKNEIQIEIQNAKTANEKNNDKRYKNCKKNSKKTFENLCERLRASKKKKYTVHCKYGINKYTVLNTV